MWQTLSSHYQTFQISIYPHPGTVFRAECEALDVTTKPEWMINSDERKGW